MNLLSCFCSLFTRFASRGASNVIISSYFLVASNISEKEHRIAKSSIFANCLIISG
ncbi:hypothetical protein [Rickettsia koreansis]|uniref:hypothetical protein n=1 Tax=Rickettsia koreansis TaxID=2358204 RepID=UPI00397C3132